MCALKNVKEVELIGMPKLKKCVLMGGLKNVESVKMENAGKFESVKGLKELMEEERKKREEEEERKKREEEEERKRREMEECKREEEEKKRKKKEEEKKRRKEERRKREEMMALAKNRVSIRNVEDMKKANCYVGVIIIASNCCNDRELSVLDLSRFVNLRKMKVGDECFKYVKEVKLIGLNQLERVLIGKNCFTKKKNDCPRSINPNRHFYLKNCERVRELKMGCYSFNGYSVCEIENVPSLEVIEMGELNEKSYNFRYAPLELKSDCERMK